MAGDGRTYPQGPASWLDTHLTVAEMASVVPGAGQGPKITVKFKAKIFSFGHVVVDGNKLTHYQISETLLPTSSASSINPAPYGVDYYGRTLGWIGQDDVTSVHVPLRGAELRGELRSATAQPIKFRPGEDQSGAR